MENKKICFKKNQETEIDANILKIRVFLSNHCKIGTEKKRQIKKAEVAFLSKIILLLIGQYKKINREDNTAQIKPLYFLIERPISIQMQYILRDLTDVDIELRMREEKLTFHRPIQAEIVELSCRISISNELCNFLADKIVLSGI